MRSGRRLSAFLPVLRAVQQRLASRHQGISWEKILLALGLGNEDDATARDAWLVTELILIRVFERVSEQNPEILNDLEELTVDESTLSDE